MPRRHPAPRRSSCRGHRWPRRRKASTIVRCCSSSARTTDGRAADECPGLGWRASGGDRRADDAGDLVERHGEVDRGARTRPARRASRRSSTTSRASPTDSASFRPLADGSVVAVCRREVDQVVDRLRQRPPARAGDASAARPGRSGSSRSSASRRGWWTASRSACSRAAALCCTASSAFVERAEHPVGDARAAGAGAFELSLGALVSTIAVTFGGRSFVSGEPISHGQRPEEPPVNLSNAHLASNDRGHR